MNYTPWPEDKTGRAHVMATMLSQDQYYYLHKLAEFAKIKKIPLYIVGGFVRDILLGYPSTDMDLVVEGDALIFANLFIYDHGGKIIQHKRFKTASLFLPSIHKTGELVSFDVASARTEIYKKPGSLPLVKRASIKEDLLRRDFTINTLAIRIDNDNFGELIDEVNGLNDLVNGVVRILHPSSFRDDPTRIFRAARYAGKFGFNLSDDTINAVGLSKDGIIGLSAHRTLHELNLIMDEENTNRVIGLLREWGILKRIHPTINRRFINRSSANLVDVDNKYVARYLKWALWLMVLPVEKIKQIDKRLHFPKKLREVLFGASIIYYSLDSIVTMRPSEVVNRFSVFPLEAILSVFLVMPDGILKEKVKKYIYDWRKIKPVTTGATLISLGIPPGPKYNAILNLLRDSAINGEIKTNKDERELLDRFIRDME